MAEFRQTSPIDPGRRALLAAAGIGAVAMASCVNRPVARGLSLAPAVEALIPFRSDVPDTAIVDLKRRLDETRWPHLESVADRSQGVRLVEGEGLIAYWRTRYDWRRLERRLNTYDQYRTLIDGIGIHVIHAKSSHSGALPLILTHGWPGSFVEFLDSIEPLRDPTKFGGSAKDAFDVIIPSLPGFGFSDAPTDPWPTTRIASAWAVLMERLGYQRWVAQGGDWGSGVTHALGHLRPAGLLGAHVNWPLVFPTAFPATPTPEEKRAMDAAAAFGSDGSGYFNLQATRPQTVGYALADSAAGQAMWIYEKIQSWTDNAGEPETAIAIDSILDDISLYWFTNTAATSARIYWDNTRAGPAGFSAGRIELPMSATIFPKEIYRAPKAWAQAMWPNLFYWNEVDEGGHFAAWEQPDLFVRELRKAFGILRRS